MKHAGGEWGVEGVVCCPSQRQGQHNLKKRLRDRTTIWGKKAQKLKAIKSGSRGDNFIQELDHVP